MVSTRLTITALFAAASVLVTGCAATTDVTSDEALVGSQSDELRADITGEWESSSGPIYRLELTSEYAETLGGGYRGSRFTATIDTGVRCIQAPCDEAQTEVSGVYQAKNGKLTLAAFDRPSLAFSRILGDYRYRQSGGSLTLTKRDGTFESTFRRAVYCVTYVATDDQGVSLRNFYAINVSSYAAGKEKLAAAAPNFVNEAITPGRCNTPRACTREYAPVCGTPVGAQSQTFGNLCMFQDAIRTRAGATGESKGHWEVGECNATAGGCSSDADCRSGFCGWTESEARVCKAYAKRGERCGGFVLPAFRTVCAPGLTCQGPDLARDIPGTCQP